LQEAIGESSLTIPYWDWVTTPTLPKSVFEPSYRKGDTTLVNPLYDDQRYGPVGQGGPVNFADLGAPGKDERELIAIDTFENFAGAPPDGKQTKRPGYLEATPHTYIHRAIGYDQINNRIGLLTVGMAPLDPVFFLHHANVDRLWTMWVKTGGRRANPDDPSWHEQRFAFPDTKKFRLVDYRIADLLNTEKSVGHYRYDRESTGPVANAGVLVLRGVPISPLPATIRVFVERAGTPPALVGSISTIPAQTGKMDAVLPISSAQIRLFANRNEISIRARVTGTDASVTFDDFAIDLPQ
jgi:tyrosinase